MTVVLGIESSCDETAAALVRDDGRVLSDAVSSQVKLHAPYGGVVPELASRAHVTNLVPVLEAALAERDLDEVDAVAVTNGPGLVGALLVGVQAAKSIALARGLPLIGVNHLVGHLLAVHLRRDDAGFSGPEYPYIALLVSGGHTALYEVRSALDIQHLGQTRDDAAGEAFDKVAKLLGLGYPGGPRIDRLAAQGSIDPKRFPRPMAHSDSLEFSFSGLKTHVAQELRRHGVPRGEQALSDFCASFQHTVVSVLVDKALAACAQRGVPRLVITGGVAANRGLRALGAERAAAREVSLFVPPPVSCTDNAAMIAYAGACKLATGHVDAPALGVFSRSPMLGERPGQEHGRRYRSMRLPRPQRDATPGG